MPLWLRTLVLSFLFLAVLPAKFSSSDNQDGSPEIESLVLHQLEAVKACDHPAFVQYGNPAFQTLMDRLSFENLCLQESDKLKKGYELKYLGEINKTGMRLHLFKVDIDDDQEDLLARITLAHGNMANIELD